MADPRDPFELAGVTIDGKYRVASVIGDGGFGVVYRGVHKGFGELIAIKCLKLPTELDEAARAELLEKLQDEGRLLHRLSKVTNGIVQALDVGAFTTPKGVWVPYLVLEWLEGQTLGEYLKDRPEGGMDLADALRLLEPAARALAVAHAQKIAHRDVKPANIFLSEGGGKRTAKVLDFGIAKVLSDHRGYTTALEATAQAPTAFTPRYGAPEQFNKQRGATGPWTDVFALALVLVECVSGRKALLGDDATQLYIASADPAMRPTLRACGVQVSDEVDDVLRHALEIEPKNRFPDAGSFWTALEEAAQFAGSETIPAGARASRPRSDAPPRPEAEDEPMLETGEYAERRKLGVPSTSREAGSQRGKTGLGPTVPVESLRSPRDAAGRGVAGRRERASHPTRKQGAPDPMEETPEGERKAAAPSKKAGAAERAAVTTAVVKAEPSRSRGGLFVSMLAIAVFGGGAWFAYATLIDSSRPTVPSSSSSAKAKPTAKPKPTASDDVTTEPSSAPSGTPSAIASGSASAVVAPVPPPEGMVLIRAATFPMGEDGAATTIEKDFYLETREVTVDQYQDCIRARRCSPADKTVGLDASEVGTWDPKCNQARDERTHPVNCVTAAQAEAYCQWRGRRLPTDVEWELAARGTRGRNYVWGGGDPNCALACYDRNERCLDSGKGIVTCQCGQFPEDQTDDHVYDLAGNVAEWTSVGGDDRVVRGGSFFDGPESLRTTYKREFNAAWSHPTIGFRCALAADAAQPIP